MRERARRSISVLCGTAALAIAASACASSTTSSSAQGAASGGPSLTGPPITLLSINILSGPTSTEPEVPVAAQAAVKAINAAGGIKGRPIKVINCDDGGGQNASVACAREAVQDKVLAVVGDSSAYGDTDVPIITAAGIPLIGPVPNSVAELSNPLSFPLTSNAVENATQAILMEKLGCKHIKVMAADIPVVQYTLQSGFEAPLAKVGGHVDAVVAPPATATDLSPYISSLAANADCTTALTSGDQALIVAKGLAQDDYTGKFVFGTLQWGQKEITELGSAADNVYLVGGEALATDTAVPGIVQFNKEMDATGNMSVSRDMLAVNEWMTIHLVAQLAGTLSAITPQNLVAALKAKPVSFEGITAPVNFSKPNTTFAPAPQVTYNTLQKVYKVTDGKLVPMFGGKFVDASDPASWPAP
jgi:ABC-type branched-subunit amino acid transport system substrate-binding protein